VLELSFWGLYTFQSCRRRNMRSWNIKVIQLVDCHLLDSLWILKLIKKSLWISVCHILMFLRFRQFKKVDVQDYFVSFHILVLNKHLLVWLWSNFSLYMQSCSSMILCSLTGCGRDFWICFFGSSYFNFLLFSNIRSKLFVQY